jgi:hypothetical protein
MSVLTREKNTASLVKEKEKEMVQANKKLWRFEDVVRMRRIGLESKKKG